MNKSFITLFASLFVSVTYSSIEYLLSPKTDPFLGYWFGVIASIFVSVIFTILFSIFMYHFKTSRTAPYLFFLIVCVSQLLVSTTQGVLLPLWNLSYGFISLLLVVVFFSILGNIFLAKYGQPPNK